MRGPIHSMTPLLIEGVADRAVGQAMRMTIMEPYAVVETGGKQYLVKVGDALNVELLEGEAGGTIALTTVLAISDGKTLKVGTPTVAGAKVSVEVVEQKVRGPKVIAFKKKRRKGYRHKVGHRQKYTAVRVASIG